MRVGPALRRHPAVLVAAVAALPVLLAFVRFVASTDVLDGDEAVFAAQVTDAATGGFPTVGLYSRFGWNHPGPAAFYAFAPFHWLSGGAVWGVLLGAAVWNVAAVAVTVWMAARRGGTTLVCLAAAAHVATWIAVGGVATLDPWTPNLAAVLVVPLLLAAWGASVGDDVGWAVFLVVASLVVQLHVGYAVIVAIVGAVALVRRRPRTRVALRGVGVAVVLWLPVLLDELTRRTGNDGALWRYFRRDDAPNVGAAGAARLVASEVSPLPNWITGPRTTGLFREASSAGWWWLLLPIGGLLAARLVAGRRSDDRADAAVLVAGAGLVAALVAASQVRGIRFHYLFFWRTPIVLFVVIAVGLAVATRVGAGVRRAAATGLLVAATVGAAGAALSSDQVTRHGDDVAALIDRIGARPDGRVLVRLADTGFVGAGPGVMGWLEAHGAEVGVDESVAWVFGDRAMSEATADEVWYVTDTGWALSLLTELPGARLVAARTPLDDDDEAALRSLHRRLATELATAGFQDDVASLDSPLVELALAEVPGIDRDALAQLARWNETVGDPGTRFGIVAFAPGDAPQLPWRLQGF